MLKKKKEKVGSMEKALGLKKKLRKQIMFCLAL